VLKRNKITKINGTVNIREVCLRPVAKGLVEAVKRVFVSRAKLGIEEYS